MLVLSLAGVAAAAEVPTVNGVVGFTVVPSPGQEEGLGTPSNPLSASDVFYVDIMMYNTGAEPAFGINSTGELSLTLTGPGELSGYAPGEYGQKYEDYGLIPSLDSIGVSYFLGTQGTSQGFQYIPPGTPPPYPPAPAYEGWNVMQVYDAQNMMIGGGLPSGVAEWLVVTPEGTAVVFDHIAIHCTGPEPVQITLAPAADPGPFGRPVVNCAGTGYANGIDEGALGGSLTIYQVPEPITMGLLSLGGLALLRRRR